MALQADSKFAVAGGVGLTIVYAVGGIPLGIFTHPDRSRIEWFWILVDLANGTVSPVVLTYLFGPGVVIGGLVYGAIRLSGIESAGWADVKVYLFLVLTPTVGMLVFGFAYGMVVTMRFLGVIGGLTLGLPFVVVSVLIADSVLLVATAASVAVGYVVIRGGTGGYRRLSEKTTER